MQWRKGKMEDVGNHHQKTKLCPLILPEEGTDRSLWGPRPNTHSPSWSLFYCHCAFGQWFWNLASHYNHPGSCKQSWWPSLSPDQWDHSAWDRTELSVFHNSPNPTHFAWQRSAHLSTPRLSLPLQSHLNFRLPFFKEERPHLPLYVIPLM